MSFSFSFYIIWAVDIAVRTNTGLVCLRFCQSSNRSVVFRGLLRCYLIDHSLSAEATLRTHLEQRSQNFGRLVVYIWGICLGMRGASFSAQATGPFDLITCSPQVLWHRVRFPDWSGSFFPNLGTLRPIFGVSLIFGSRPNIV